MTLDDALARDKELKARFLAVIAAKQQLDNGTIAKVDVCALGHWLYGEGERKYKFLKAYKPCVDAHAAFHALAGKVARQINLGEYAAAEAALADDTPYAKAMSTVEATVQALKRDAKL